MNVLTGDETGLLKLIDIKKKAFSTYSPLTGNVESTSSRNSSLQSRSIGIRGLCWMKGNNESVPRESYSTLRADGVVDIWRYQHDNSHTYLMNSFPTLSEGISAGIVEIPQSQTEGANRNESSTQLLSYSENGHVSVDFFKCSFNDGSSRSEGLISTASIDTSRHIDFTVKSPLAACAACQQGGVLLGGKENDLKMYDLNVLSDSSKDAKAAEPVWQAKNVPHDYLNLRVPIWITDMSILRPMESSVSKAHVISGTGHKHLRIYDTSASRQPVLSMDLKGDYRVTSICPTHNGDSCYYGDTAGNVYQWDLRMQRNLYTLKGFAGSVRSIQLNESGSQIACVGLDRFLRVYDTTKGNKQVNSFYLKNRLNKCLITGDTEVPGKGKKGKSTKRKGVEGGKEEGDGTYDGNDDLLEAYVDSDEEDSDDDTDGGEEDEDDGKKEDEAEEDVNVNVNVDVDVDDDVDVDVDVDVDDDDDDDDDDNDGDDDDDDDGDSDDNFQHNSRAQRNRQRSQQEGKSTAAKRGPSSKSTASRDRPHKNRRK